MKSSSHTSVNKFVNKEPRTGRRQENNQHGNRSRNQTSTKGGPRWKPKGAAPAINHGALPSSPRKQNRNAGRSKNNRPGRGGNRRSKRDNRSSKARYRNQKGARSGQQERKTGQGELDIQNVPQQQLQFHAHDRSRTDRRPREGKAGRNLNHLLNFSYGETPNRTRYGRHSHGIRTRAPTRNVPFDKEKFVQATYRFVVDKQKADEAKCRADPDYCVDWNAVEQVIYPTHTVPDCPICMDKPVCPKITKCGHIFCWTCVMQYLSDGKKYKRCPLCFESVYADRLKSLRFHTSKEVKVGDTVKFQLVEREKVSVLPRAFGSEVNHEELVLQDPMNASPLHRVSLTENVLPILRDEQSQLCESRRNILSKSERERIDEARALPYIENALDRLRERTNTWLNTHMECKETLLSLPQNQLRDAFDSDDDEPVITSPKPKLKSSLSAKAAAWTPPSERLESQKSKYFYFQALDDHHIFMHGINFRCLSKEFGRVDEMPKNLSAKVLGMERFTLDYETRAKYKFLGHLPLLSQIAICFLDIQHLVSLETLAEFKEPLMKMKKKLDKLKRAKKKEEERKRMHEKMLKNMPVRRNTDDEFMDFRPLEAPVGAEAFPDLVETKLSDGDRSTPSNSPQMTGWSDVIKKGYAERDWPTLGGTGYSPETRTPEGSHPTPRQPRSMPPMHIGSTWSKTPSLDGHTGRSLFGADGEISKTPPMMSMGLFRASVTQETPEDQTAKGKRKRKKNKKKKIFLS
mmetsp:Transcript_13819/g.27963  ORF Transcript_13819/g.27963 Transcript_13819/m.27963 type:complete len:746 (+) Transcript_13819:95-2332(+)